MPLSLQELSVLIELARRADRIVQREELFRLAWGREMRAGDRSVDVYVRRLRVKLERVLPEWRCIHTHFGLGYRLAPELTRRADTSSKPDDARGSDRSENSPTARRRH